MARRPAGDPLPRSDWLALAAADLPSDLGEPIRTVPDAAAFLDLLERMRPRLAIVAEPPATVALVERVAAERHRRPSMRIVYLAPDDAVEERLRALRLGFDDAFGLGMAPDELLGRLQLLDEQARAVGRTPTAIPLGNDMELDVTARELRRDGRPVHLRPKEYGLLAMLACHPGRAYTRRQLLDRVWGPDHDGDPRTVDVHIRWLRSKVEAEPARPVHLVTVRGIGYRLDPPGGR